MRIADYYVISENIMKSLKEEYKLNNPSVYITSETLFPNFKAEWIRPRVEPTPNVIATNPRSITLNYTDGSHYTIKHVKNAVIMRLKDGSSTLTLSSREKRSQKPSEGITEQLSVDSTTIDTRLLKSVTIVEVVDGFKQSRVVSL
jgi:hypothetical protein